MDPVIAALPVKLQVQERGDHRTTTGNIDGDAVSENVICGGRTELQLLVVLRAELDVGIDSLLELVGIDHRGISGAPPVAILGGVVAGNVTEIEIPPQRARDSRQLLLVLVVGGAYLVPARLLNLADEIGAHLVAIVGVVAARVGRDGHDVPVGLGNVDVPIAELGLTGIPLAVGVAVFVLEAAEPGSAAPDGKEVDEVDRGVILDGDLEVSSDT